MSDDAGWEEVDAGWEEAPAVAAPAPPAPPKDPPKPPGMTDIQLQTAAIARLMSRIQHARQDPAAFIEFAMHAPDGSPIDLAPFHREWLATFQSHNRVLIEAPRGHGKTSIAIGYALWLLGNNPNLRIKFVGQNDERAKERLFEFRTHLENNQMVRLVFPNLKPAADGEWTKTKLYVERTTKTRDASFEAFGINTSVTGGRIDVLFCDDVCDLRNSVLYPTMREQVKTKFFGELIPTLETDGRVIYIATPYHMFDLTAVLKLNSSWLYKHYGIGTASDPFKPLWPAKWTRELLMAKRSEIGSAAEFDRAYRCVALSSATVPFDPNWLQYYDAELLGDPNRHVCVLGYDLAISKKTSADYFACVTILYDQDRHIIFVADAYQGRFSFAEQGRQVVQDAQKWTPERIMIERVGLGGALESYLEEKAPFPLPVFPYIPKGDKEFRFKQITPFFEDLRVFFHPNLDPLRNPFLGDRGDIVGQIMEFPLANHDDLVDALITAVNGLADFRMGDMEEAGFQNGEGTSIRLSVVG